ncbi:MAG: DDE-type integrase/transposase/recombinase [Oscillospiraceae bacterium]|jgi:transposase InsO family protein|nr:DDE-type integrase/transposase/recombinase [Oscillospiraceae bacterium]
MTDNRRPEEIAVSRHKIIAPILIATEEKADAAKLVQLKKEICRQNGISERTLRRWLRAHNAGGFEGLKPVPAKILHPSIIPDDLIEEAILLRREVPSRSVPQIIEILELEGKAPEGFLKKSTLHDRLMERGYSARHMRLYQQGGMAARRFARRSRNDLWHSDIKFGPYLTIKGEKKQIYLVSFLDDATRYIVHAEFYESLDQTIVEDCFRKAILKEGLPQRVYFDNGKQYRTKWMERACAMMEIKLLFAKPYSPESTGKIERFNRTVDSFLNEVALKKPASLDDYNRYFEVWLQECYHKRTHGGLDNSPESAYRDSKTPLRFLPAETVALAFTRFETRKVDKSGCINFGGKKYEASPTLIGQTVNVLYDPADIETVTVEHQRSGVTMRVRELKIGVHTGPRPKPPVSAKTAETSRLLDEKEKRYQKHQDIVRRAISFKAINEGGETDV